MRKHEAGYQYRGLVRRGTDYIYSGHWMPTQIMAARDAQLAAGSISERERISVKHQ